MDMGGHRFFSKDPKVNEWWNQMLPLQGAPAYDDIVLARTPPCPGRPRPEKADRVMLNRSRVSRIYFDKKFFDYPITLKWETFKNMGLVTTVQAAASYAASVLHRREENSLEDFYINRFGKKLYSMFFEKYTENLWGRSPSEIDPSWGAQRAKGLSVMAWSPTCSKSSSRQKDRPCGDLPHRGIQLSQARSGPALGRDRSRDRKNGRTHPARLQSNPFSQG